MDNQQLVVTSPSASRNLALNLTGFYLKNERIFSACWKGLGTCSPIKFKKIEPMKLADIGFQSNLPDNF